MCLIDLISLGHDFGCGEGSSASAVAVHFLGVPVDTVTDGLLTGRFEVFDLDDDVLEHRDEILTLGFGQNLWAPRRSSRRTVSGSAKAARLAHVAAAPGVAPMPASEVANSAWRSRSRHGAGLLRMPKTGALCDTG